MLEKNRKEFERCRITDYHAAGKLGQEITVVVLDDGGKLFDFMGDYCKCPLGVNLDSKGHAVCVARVIHEVAPQAKIISLPYTRATIKQKKVAIDWILEHKDEVDIVNCSFREGPREFFKNLQALNIPVVCASGNDNKEDWIAYPARYSWTIAVGALEEYRDKVAGYSNEGPELDCLGYTNIWIPLPNGKAMEFNGTSCAAPMVAGMLALLMSAIERKLSGAEAKEIIKNNCIDYYKEGHDWRSGWGLFVLPKLSEVSKLFKTSKVIKIGIDPGHGGKDPGAIGPNGTREADINLAVAYKLARYADFNNLGFCATRADDRYVELNERSLTINLAQCAIAVSLHCNADDDPKTNYLATFIQAKGGQAERLANCIQKNLVKETGLKDGGVRVKNLHMTRETYMPAVLVEMGFITNPEHENNLNNQDYQQKLARGIFAGICEYLGRNFVDPVDPKPVGGDNVPGFEGPAKVVFEGKELKAGILDGKTYVEVRKLAEMLGLQVTWDNDTKTVKLMR